MDNCHPLCFIHDPFTPLPMLSDGPDSDAFHQFRRCRVIETPKKKRRRNRWTEPDNRKDQSVANASSSDCRPSCQSPRPPIDGTTAGRQRQEDGDPSNPSNFNAAIARTLPAVAAAAPVVRSRHQQPTSAIHRRPQTKPRPSAPTADINRQVATDLGNALTGLRANQIDANAPHQRQ